MDRTDSRLAPSPEAASDDVASPFNLPPAEAVAQRVAPDDPAPWECDPPAECGRQRHDAFTGAKKQQYLKALAKTGCILDACRITGVSSSTVYNHQASDPDFARKCGLAVGMASTPIELTAYERAVIGQEEPVIRGGQVVGTRIKRSDYMLRVLLKGGRPQEIRPPTGLHPQAPAQVRAQADRARGPRRAGRAPTLDGTGHRADRRKSGEHQTAPRETAPSRRLDRARLRRVDPPGLGLGR